MTEKLRVLQANSVEHAGRPRSRGLCCCKSCHCGFNGRCHPAHLPGLHACVHLRLPRAVCKITVLTFMCLSYGHTNCTFCRAQTHFLSCADSAESFPDSLRHGIEPGGLLPSLDSFSHSKASQFMHVVLDPHSRRRPTLSHTLLAHSLVLVCVQTHGSRMYVSHMTSFSRMFLFQLSASKQADYSSSVRYLPYEYVWVLVSVLCVSVSVSALALALSLSLSRARARSSSITY